jgi:hypothetical protein
MGFALEIRPLKAGLTKLKWAAVAAYLDEFNALCARSGDREGR